nr:unnamed protein product [Callosobruchus analis]
MDLNVILSEKGKQLLVVNNFKYSFQKCLKSGERRWICLSKKCKSFILSLANLEKLNRQIVSSSCKRKATEDLSEKPAKIIRRVVQDNLPSTITTCDVAYVRRNMYNARRKMQLALPKNIEETFDILEDTSIETNTGEPFIMFNDKTDQIVVFSCKSNIEFLGKVTRIYLDGTFSYCPKFFCQFFTVQGYYNGHYIPLVFSLLPNKLAQNSAELTRTTNACESFHKHFNDSFYKAHPNIFSFLEKLKEFQMDTYVKLQSVHLSSKIHNSKVKNRQKFITKMIDAYKKQEINRFHFIKCISFHCGFNN